MDSRKPTPDYNFSIAMKYHYKFAVKILYTIFIQLEVYLYRIHNPDLVDHMCPTTHWVNEHPTCLSASLQSSSLSSFDDYTLNSLQGHCP